MERYNSASMVSTSIGLPANILTESLKEQVTWGALNLPKCTKDKDLITLCKNDHPYKWSDPIGHLLSVFVQVTDATEFVRTRPVNQVLSVIHLRTNILPITCPIKTPDLGISSKTVILVHNLRPIAIDVPIERNQLHAHYK